MLSSSEQIHSISSCLSYSSIPTSFSPTLKKELAYNAKSQSIAASRDGDADDTVTSALFSQR